MSKEIVVGATQWKLRRLAPRALSVLERHRELSTLQHFEQTLPVTVAKFVELYDSGRVLVASRRTVSGLPALETLRARILSWSGPVARDIPGMDVKALANQRVTAVDDVVSNGERLLELARSHAASGKGELPYLAQLEQSMTAAIADVRTQWEQFQAQMAKEQATLAEARLAAQALHRELIAFRRALRGELGASHRDYRQLLIGRQQDDAENDTQIVDDAQASPTASLSTPKPTAENVTPSAQAQ